MRVFEGSVCSHMLVRISPRHKQPKTPDFLTRIGSSPLCLGDSSLAYFLLGCRRFSNLLLIIGFAVLSIIRTRLSDLRTFGLSDSRAQLVIDCVAYSPAVVVKAMKRRRAVEVNLTITHTLAAGVPVSARTNAKTASVARPFNLP